MIIELIAYALELIVKILTISWQAREEARKREEAYKLDRAKFKLIAEKALSEFVKDLNEDNKQAKSLDDEWDKQEKKK